MRRKEAKDGAGGRERGGDSGGGGRVHIAEVLASKLGMMSLSKRMEKPLRMGLSQPHLGMDQA